MTAHKTKTGRVLTDAELDALADEVESTDYRLPLDAPFSLQA